MNELPPNPVENKDAERERKKKKSIALAIELSERTESFPFLGMDADSYAKVKADQEQMPGYSTPIDKLLQRFEREGMKVVLGDHPESGNIFVLPFGSNDIVNDNLFPRHLQLTETMDETLQELVRLHKELKSK